MHHLRVTTLALAALLTIPVGLAAPWGAKGQYEPDTTFDKTGVYMWPTADRSPQTIAGGAPGGLNAVYFNAYTQQNTGYSTHGFDLSANLATIQLERQSWPGNLAALLGVWKDCNGDNYIGLADQGLMEYRSELLVGPLTLNICPPSALGQAPPAGSANSYNWSGALIHNDGIWVREFIPIGPDAARPNLADGNPYDVNDLEAHVWGDWGTPGAPPPPTSCGLVFIPQHSFHSTGGLLYYADCMDGYVVTDLSTAFLTALGQGGLSFGDHPRDQYNSASPLNQPNPWGEPGDDSAVTVWDCSRPAASPHVQPNNVFGFQVSQPAGDPNPNTGGSLGGTVNHTATGADDCDQSDNYKGDWENSLAQGIYGNEGKSRPNAAGERFQTDFPMAYNEGARPLVAIVLPSVPGGRTMALDSTRRADTSGVWVSGSRIAEDRNPYLSRDTMLNGQPIAGIQYTTTYASLGSAAIAKYNLAFPSTAIGIYGSEACGTHTDGVWGGWKCSPADWPNCTNDDEAGYACNGLVLGDANADTSVKVGHSYQLRDVDCYDTSAMVLRDDTLVPGGIGWGTLTQSTNCR